MIDTSKELFEENSGTYLYHLTAGEEIRIDFEEGKTLSITGQAIHPADLSQDNCDVITSKERFRANGSWYYADLRGEQTIGVILDEEKAVLLSSRVLEKTREKPYTVSFEQGREFSLTESEMNRALEIVEVAAVDDPVLLGIHEKMREQAEAGDTISLTLEDGSRLMQVWQDEDQLFRLFGSCPSDQDAHLLDEFQNFDGRKERMFANIMEGVRNGQPDLSLTEEDLDFTRQMTLDEFGLE